MSEYFDLEITFKLYVYFNTDLQLNEEKLNEKEILKVLVEVSVTRSEAEIVNYLMILKFIKNIILFFFFFLNRN